MLMGCISFILGVCLSSFFVISNKFYLLVIILSLCVLVSFRKRACFYLIILSLGGLLFNVSYAGIVNNEIVKYFDKGVEIMGRICENPEKDLEKQKLKIAVEGVDGADVDAKVLVSVDLFSDYSFGDEVVVSGILQEPMMFDGFDYRGYLAKEGVSAVMYYPEVEIIKDGFNVFFLKDKLKEQIVNDLSFDNAAILSAMILGDKGMMTEGLEERLNYAGVRHITAISGMHIAIISLILLKLLLFFRIRKEKALIVSLVLLWGYVFFVGMPASALRAVIMISFLFFAQLMGRQSDSLRVLVYAGAFMLLFNPLLLKYDIGFQLSFLAVLGIILFYSLFKSWINLKYVSDILAVTFSAQVFTLPILVHNFGYFSLISPLTNLLIVPILPFVLGFGFLFSFVGIVFPLLGKILSFPCLVLLGYINKVVYYCSSFYLSHIEVNIPTIVFVLLYIVLLFFAYKLKKKYEFSI